MWYRLERSNKPPSAAIVGKYHVPKRDWRLFGRFPVPVHPSTLSSAGEASMNQLIGIQGQQVRLVQDDPSNAVVAVYEWTKVDVNPGDGDSDTVWGWKLIASAAPQPERNHTIAGSAYIPSVGIDTGTYVPTTTSDHVEQAEKQNERMIKQFGG